VRSFIKAGQENEQSRTSPKTEDKTKPETRKISKNVGDYVDYEELRGNNN
jgi:hypothetical protein